MYICPFVLGESKCISCKELSGGQMSPFVEPPSLASVLLNLIVSNFPFKPFKITPGLKKPANQLLMIKAEKSPVIQGALTDSWRQSRKRMMTGFPLIQDNLRGGGGVKRQ